MKKLHFYLILLLTLHQIHAQDILVLYGGQTSQLSQAEGHAADLSATGAFDSVDAVIWDAPNKYDINYLNAYDAIMVVTNGGYNASYGMGGILKTYVDNGGGVGIFLFANASIQIGGAWNYHALVPAGQSMGPTYFGTIDIPTHPALNYPFAINTSTWNVGSFWSSTSNTLAPEAYSIAKFSDGRPALQARENVGVNGTGKVIDLAVSPSAAFGSNKTQGYQLFANVMMWLTGSTPPSGYSVAMDALQITTANQTDVSFTITAAEIGATYNYTISSDNGGTPVTGTGTISTATEQISGIDLSGLQDGTLTLSFTLTDGASNEGDPATDTAAKDTMTLTPTLVHPAADGVSNHDMTISYVLPESSLSGSIRLTFTASEDPNSPIVLLLSDVTTPGETVDFTINPYDLDNALQVVSASTESLRAGTVYEVILSYQDALENPTATTTNDAHTLQATDITSLRMYSNNDNPLWATLGDRIVVEFELNAPMQEAAVSILGSTLMLSPGDAIAPNTYMAWIDITEDHVEGPVAFNLILNPNGENSVLTNTTDGSNVTIDKTPPQPSLVIGQSIYLEPFSIELHFSEAVVDLASFPVIVGPDANGNPAAELSALIEIIPGEVYRIDVTPFAVGELLFFNDMLGMARDLAGNVALPLGFVDGTFFDVDNDGDGIPDSEDPDDDNDGILDTEDNCPTTPNPDQADLDGDGIGDVCDDDIDGDGVPNDQEILDGTDPRNPLDYKDTDGDGVPDFVEGQDGTDPNDPSDFKDTDGDGVPDYIENIEGTDPTDANDFKDEDGDGIPDYINEYQGVGPSEPDTDGDGVSDSLDLCPDTPEGAAVDANGCSVNQIDTDGDGIADVEDNCPEIYNPGQEDRDGDGLGDVCDTVELNVSQAFTPNGDGINDTWVIYNIENYPNSLVRVFNSWGKEVFSVRNYQNDWDGRYKNLSDKLPDAGSYYFQIDFDGDGNVDQDGWLYITSR